MTPMIDVVFLLLVFFLWTSSFQEPEFDLPSSLAAEPKAATTSRGESEPLPEPFDEIVIEVGPAEQLTLNGQPIVTTVELTEKLLQIAELGAQPSVIVDPHETTPIGRAIEIYDAARSARFDRVLFAAKPATD